MEADFIGTNADGTAAVPNGDGIVVEGNTTGTIIGGTAPGAGNLISGNGQSGMHIVGPATNTVILGNSRARSPV
jgi:titin